jgi:hypothetical protein
MAPEWSQYQVCQATAEPAETVEKEFSPTTLIVGIGFGTIGFFDCGIPGLDSFSGAVFLTLEVLLPTGLAPVSQRSIHQASLADTTTPGDQQHPAAW